MFSGNLVYFSPFWYIAPKNLATLFRSRGKQGCQMAHLHTKKQLWYILEGLEMEKKLLCIFYRHLVYFVVYWHIFFVIYIVYLMVIWYIFFILVCCLKRNLATLAES
jgi:hypothetical protein